MAASRLFSVRKAQNRHNKHTNRNESGRGSRLRAMSRRFMEFADDFRPYFQVGKRNVAHRARGYLAGLMMKAERKNMERMGEFVEDFDYHSQQQFLSDSPWDHNALMDRVAQEVGGLLGGPQSGLLIDESGFEKKGDMSVGVARQYNGRLGKVDNCQVGVFAGLSDGVNCGLVDARIYLPECWVSDTKRCQKARIPEAEQVHRSKPQIALEMVDRAIELGLEFGWVGFDALYGSSTWLLREIEDRGLVFVADVRKDEAVHPSDPRTGSRASSPRPLRIDELFKQVPVRERRTVVVRDGTKGTIKVRAVRRRIWRADQAAGQCREWWALCIYCPDGSVKYALSNADKAVPLTQMVRQHSTRYWIERAFQDAKTSVGMADYQARGWRAWHHHMAMVLLALLFMIKERRVYQDDVDLLSCQDIVDLLNVVLPRADLDPEAVLDRMEERHRRRQEAIDSAYRKQGSTRRRKYRPRAKAAAHSGKIPK